MKHTCSIDSRAQKSRRNILRLIFRGIPILLEENSPCRLTNRDAFLNLLLKIFLAFVQQDIGTVVYLENTL